MLTVSLRVNNEVATRLIEPRETLADFLREHCNLTGTHLGYELGGHLCRCTGYARIVAAILAAGVEIAAASAETQPATKGA